MTPRYVLVVDQSTSASKVFLVDAQGMIVRAFSRPHAQRCPAPGCAEQDAEAIYQNVLAGIAAVCEGLETEEIAALGLSNQRKTVVLWDRWPGRPLGPAIGWQDVRGEALCRALSQKSEAVRSRTGLSLSPYYPAAKIAAALREAPALRKALREGRLCAGTMDSYLVFRLTGGTRFCTDLSNASRTQLFDIRRLAWDAELCRLFDIDIACLPQVQHSDGDFGAGLGRWPIAAVLGDSHAALLGQGCL